MHVDVSVDANPPGCVRAEQPRGQETAGAWTNVHASAAANVDQEAIGRPERRLIAEINAEQRSAATRWYAIR